MSGGATFLPAPMAMARRTATPWPGPGDALRALELPDLAGGPGQRRPSAAALRSAATEATAAETRDAALRASHAQGHAAGEAAGRAAAAIEHATARATLEAAALTAAASALQEIAATADAAVGQAAEALARLLLAALDAALPAASAHLATDSAVQLAAAVRPALERAGSITLRVAPGLAESVATRLADDRVTVVEDAALAPGDARAAWRDGEAVALLADRRAALAVLLESLGLGHAAPMPEEG